MKTKVLMSVAGLAACGAADAQVRPELQTAEFSGQTFQAVRATKIIARTMDGQYVYGPTIELNGNANGLRLPGTRAYDAAQMADTDGDTLEAEPVCGDAEPHNTAFGGGTPSTRWFFGTNFSFQSNYEDIIPAAGTEGGVISSFGLAGIVPLCDLGAGTVSDQLSIILESWEGFDNFPDGGGLDGEFGATPDNEGFPASRSDNDGDTFVDEFVGGVILDFGLQASFGAAGYGIFLATGLDSIGVNLPQGTDLWAGGNPGTDGRPDGGVRILWTRGDNNGAGGGPLAGGFFPAVRATPMLYGTLAMQSDVNSIDCSGGDAGFGAGDSDGILMGEGENLCGDAEGSWSGGPPNMGNEAVDDIMNTTFDVGDLTSGTPDFSTNVNDPSDLGALGFMFVINVAGGGPVNDCNGNGVEDATDIAGGTSTDLNADGVPDECAGQSTRLCADVNAVGGVTAADFSAWIAAFGSLNYRADQNGGGLGAVTPADFSAWIANFGLGAGGPLCLN